MTSGTDRLHPKFGAGIKIMTFDDHFDNDRGIVNGLVHYSEYSNAKEAGKLKRTVQTDWSEAVEGWKNVVPFPMYDALGACVTKRRAGKSDKAVEFDEWVSDSKVSVRCVGDEFDEIPVPAWKANVEQGTYRYVSNNGYYRTTKFLSQNEKREWYTVNKKYPEKVSMNWQNKRFQKEIKRLLKRDFRSKVRAKDDLRVRERTDMSMARVSKEKSELFGDKNNHKESKARVQSVLSEGHRNKSPYMDFLATKSENVRRDQAGDIIPISQSVPANLGRSTSDLFINNFTSRMNVLDRELEKDTKVRKPLENVETNKPSAMSPKPQLKEKERDESPIRDRASPRKSKDLIQQEIITVRSMLDVDRLARPELRPIEKVTPAQRFKNAESFRKAHGGGGGFTTPTQIKYTTSTGSDAANLGVSSIPSHFTIASPELEKALHSYKLAIESTKQSLLSTLSGQKNSRRGGGKNLSAISSMSAPPSIAICEPEAMSDRATKDAFIQTKLDRHGRNHDKDKGAPFIVLPEIAGKRLEVPTTTNRWL